MLKEFFFFIKSILFIESLNIFLINEGNRKTLQESLNNVIRKIIEIRNIKIFIRKNTDKQNISLL